MLCEYGCNQEAKYQFKNGKWCCSKYASQCPDIRKKFSEKKKGEKNPQYNSEGYWSNKKRTEHSKLLKGKTYIELYGISKANEIIKKSTISRRMTIEQIKEKYPLFYKVEKLRYNPDKPEEKEIQVHCKFSECENSKENGGWFTPIGMQFAHRIGSLENPKGFGESNFYCSHHCKDNCKLFRLRNDPYKNTENHYIPEYETFRQEVLRRQLEEHDYNFCEYCDSRETLHVHHEKPQKTNPLFVLDPDNGVVLCEKCHYIIGHKDECSTRNLANEVCN